MAKKTSPKKAAPKAASASKAPTQKVPSKKASTRSGARKTTPTSQDRAAKSPARRPPAAADPEALLAAIDHPLKPLILDLRALIRKTEPGLEEGVKWNALNYAASGEDRITFMARSPGLIRVIFHCGAKPRKDAKIREHIDAADLLDWPSADRAILTLRSQDEFRDSKARIASIVRDWIAATPAGA